MKQRSAFAIQRDVLFAIFLRDLKEKFAGYALGTLWLFLEPLLLMIVFIMLLGVRGAGQLGYAEPPVFVLGGIVTFRQLWQPALKGVMNAPRQYRPFKVYRQIKLFDLILSRLLVQGGVYLVVTSTLTLGLLWLGFDALPADPLGVLVAVTLVWLLAFGVGLLFALGKAWSAEFGKILDIIQLPLFLASAVLFPMSIVPAQYHAVLALNPLVHVTEGVREAWIGPYTSPVLDLGYLGLWVLVALALGMMAYRLTHKTVLVR